MLILILAALLWLALLFFTLRALKRNRRPSLRICRKLEPRRYRPAGRRGRCLRYHWQGEVADAFSAHTAAMQTEPLPPVHRKKGVSAFGVVMGVNAVLAVLVVALLVRGGVPKPGSGENTASSSASSQAAESQSSQPESTPEPTPEPTPDPTPAPSSPDPLAPECSLYDGSAYSTGTWMEVRLNEDEPNESATVTVSVCDHGTGEELWHSEEKLTAEDSISYCLEEPNNYTITAYTTSPSGVQSEPLTLTVKIYS